LLESLRTRVTAAGGALRDVAQVVVSLIDKSDFDAMNEVHASLIGSPYPARATVVVKVLIATGLRVGIVAVCQFDVPLGAQPPLSVG
jgi:enamine deaminase RidA (YjgF/YER057c/UK114 family)